jgi:hypothetical protein
MAPKPKKASTSYSPKPMSANEKRAAGFRGAITQYQINLKKKDAADAKAKLKKELKPIKSESRSKAGTSTVSKVVKRAKTVAREVRDVKTAIGTSLRDQEQNVRRAAMGVKPSGKNVGKNLRTQIKEVGSAIKSGKKGTSSDMYSKPGAYKSGTKRK